MPKQAAQIPEHLAGTPRPLNRVSDARGIRRFGFLLVPGFTYIGFAAAIEPLRMANMVAGAQHFEALTLTIDAREPGGAEMAAAASALLIQDRVRGARDRQRIPLRQRVGTSQPKLSDAATLMEANIEEPLSLYELAEQTDLSCRQLERLFRDRLHCTPSDYYMQLRLDRARQRLLHTEQPIAEIAWSCGFASASHFSKRYARFFGHSPSHERQQPGARHPVA